MMLDAALEAEIIARGVSRVTHFTNSRNLPRIFETGEIRATGQMVRQGDVFERTDQERIDGHLEYVCCNLEFPNHYYFVKATGKPNSVNYSDWALFLLDPSVAARVGTLFAPGNAAKHGGVDAREGVESLRELYSSTVYGWRRSPRHRPSSPTDVQAEILVPGPISMSEVQGIVVPDEQTLRRERGRLEQIGHNVSALPWFVSPGLFRRDSVVTAIRQSTEIAVVPIKYEEAADS